MKFTTLTAAFLASTLLAGAALAGDQTVVLSFQNLDVSTPAGDSDADAVRLETSGAYDFGLTYNVDYMNIDTAIGNSETLEVDARQMFGAFGVAASYDLANPAMGANADVFGLGAAVEYSIGAVDTYAAVTSDVDNFGDAYKALAGASFDLTEKLSVSGEVTKTYIGGMHASKGELKANYALNEQFYVQGSYGYADQGANTYVNGVSLGLGLNF